MNIQEIEYDSAAFGWLTAAMAQANKNCSKIRLSFGDFNGEEFVKIKVGEGMWSPALRIVED